MLPPIISTPTPRPKKVEKRRRSGAARAASATRGILDDAVEVDHTAAPAAAATSPHAPPPEPATERGSLTPGKLGTTTLTAVLAEQEKTNR
jgi:hypothetical protein